VQKDACKNIISQKDELIKAFMEQLKNKDEEYVKALKKQNDDVDDLIKAMRKQFIDMRNDYSDQLNIIENNFNTERQKVLNRNADEIKGLFSEQKAIEEEFMNLRSRKEDEYTREILRSSELKMQTIRPNKRSSLRRKCRSFRSAWKT